MQELRRFYTPLPPRVSAGSYHTLVLNSQGELYTFGWGMNGQLGTEDFKDRITPTRIELPARGVAVMANDHHSMVITEDGSLYTFGFEAQVESPYKLLSWPVLVILPFEVFDVSHNNTHTAYVSTLGEVYTFGNGNSGQLGTGDTLDRVNPTRIHIPGRVIAVRTGKRHTVALTDDGRVYTFGSNLYGQLGRATVLDKSSNPLHVPLPGRALRIAAGDYYTVILMDDGEIYTFGLRQHVHVIRFPERVVDISAYDDRIVALTEGCNVYLIGDENRLVDLPGPAVQVSVGKNHTVILMENGEVYSFGQNEKGQLGTGDKVRRDIPTRINLPTSRQHICTIQ
jgi:alpha-tubulin suppressor-like RCC1 family protein